MRAVLWMLLGVGCSGAPDGGPPLAPEPVPVLDRARTGAAECAVLSEPELLADTFWRSWTAIGGADRAIVAWGTNAGPVQVGAIDLAEGLVSQDPVPTSADAMLSGLVPEGGGALVAWVEGEPATELATATVDASGVPGPTASRLALSGSGPRLVPTDTGHLGVWADNDGVRTAVLDASGLAAPAVIESGYAGHLDAVAVDGGALLAWSASVPSGQQCRVALVDELGQLAAGPFELSDGDDRCDGPSLVETDGGALAAWQVWGERDATIELRGLDPRGAPRGPSVRLADPREGVVARDAGLARIDDQVAVLWSESTYVDACAGCIPDDVLHVVAVDPETLDPAFDPVALASPMAPGLRSGAMVDVGPDQLLLFAFAHHAANQPGWASLRCSTR